MVQLKRKHRECGFRASVPSHCAAHRLCWGNTWDTDLPKEVFPFGPSLRWLSCSGAWALPSQAPSPALYMQNFHSFSWESPPCPTGRVPSLYISISSPYTVPKASSINLNNTQSSKQVGSDAHQCSGFGRGIPTSQMKLDKDLYPSHCPPHPPCPQQTLSLWVCQFLH